MKTRQPNDVQKLKDFQMSFERFRLVHLAFSINDSFKKNKAMEIHPAIAVANKYDEKKKALSIRVKVSLNDGNMPFAFDVVGEGRFVFKTTPDEMTITRMATINGPAIIYPYVRETIADMTRRAGFPPLHLPPVNFIRLAAKERQAKALPKKNSKVARRGKQSR